MKGDQVPDSDHILRYVGGMHVESDEDGKPVITGGGFIAKPKDNNMPSYNWLECLSGTIDEQLQQVRNAARITYGTTAKLVRLNVGFVCTYVAENADDGHEITVIQDPLDPYERLPADPSHALMTNVPDENEPQGELIGDLISQCVLDIFPAKVSPDQTGSQ